MTLDQARVLERAQRGDGAAFDALRLTHDPVLLRLVRAQVDDPHDARDVADDAWELIRQKLPTYDPNRAPFQTWMRTWARIMLLRYHQARQRRDRAEVLFSRLAALAPDSAEGESPEEMVSRLARDVAERPVEPVPHEVYADLLRITLETASPPHQLLAFGFCKLLDWPPAQVVELLSEPPLRQLLGRFERDYVRESQLTAAEIGALLVPIWEKLELTFGEVAASPRTRRRFPALLERIVGETAFRDYYVEPSPAEDVTRWWDSVRRRVVTALGRAQGGAAAEWLRDD